MKPTAVSPQSPFIRGVARFPGFSLLAVPSAIGAVPFAVRIPFGEYAWFFVPVNGSQCRWPVVVRFARFYAPPVLNMSAGTQRQVAEFRAQIRR